MFEGATVDSAAYIAQKLSNNNSGSIKILTPNSVAQVSSVKPYYIAQRRFQRNREYVFDYLLEDREYEIVNRILQSFDSLENGYDFGVGINTGYIKSELTSEKRVNSSYHPMIPGTGLTRYCVPRTRGYILYDKAFVKSKGKLGRSLPDEKYFRSPKILVVRTRNLTLKQRIIATIDYDKKYNLNRISNIISKHGNKIEGLLGVLNSKFYNWLYSKRFLDYEIKPIYLKHSPLCNTNNETLNEIVKDILKIKARDPAADTQTLENRIDQLVYELYGLTKEEIEIVEKSGREK